MHKQVKPWQIGGLAVLAVLVAIALGLSGRTAELAHQTALEAAATPTVVPTAFNVMLVTVDPSEPTAEPMLRTGSRGEEVSAVQERLRQLGYAIDSVDGQFGPGTRAAVAAFQAQNGLAADGVIGSETRRLLFSDEALSAPTPTPQSLN